MKRKPRKKKLAAELQRYEESAREVAKQLDTLDPQGLLRAFLDGTTFEQRMAGVAPLDAAEAILKSKGKKQ